MLVRLVPTYPVRYGRGVDADQVSDVTTAGDAGTEAAPVAASQPQPGRSEQVRLAFASFLMLFVELALIRWITANNVYVTEATNFVLLASFLGIGIGFLNATSGRDYLRWTLQACLVARAFVLDVPVGRRHATAEHRTDGRDGQSHDLPQQ